MPKAIAYNAILQGMNGHHAESDTVLAGYAVDTRGDQDRLLKTLLEPELMVLDDLFLAKGFPDAAAELLQTLVQPLYKLRRSIIVTSNRFVQDGGRYLGDNTMANTILDRLMHRSKLLEFGGKSYRLKDAATRLAVSEKADS